MLSSIPDQNQPLEMVLGEKTICVCCRINKSFENSPKMEFSYLRNTFVYVKFLLEMFVMSYMRVVLAFDKVYLLSFQLRHLGKVQLSSLKKKINNNELFQSCLHKITFPCLFASLE